MGTLAASLIANLTDAVTQNPRLTTLVAFVAAIVEAVAVLGIVVPGTPILMAVAAAAALAGLSMTPILVAAIVGAVIGDGVSFWLGGRYGGRIRKTWPFSTRPALIERAEAFFIRFGACGVALARFVPVLRSTVPLVAGMAGMRMRRFLVANVLSALVWAPVHVFPAQLAGLSVESIRGGNWRQTGLIAATLLLIAAAAWGAHRLGRNRMLGGAPRP